MYAISTNSVNCLKIHRSLLSIMEGFINPVKPLGAPAAVIALPWCGYIYIKLSNNRTKAVIARLSIHSAC